MKNASETVTERKLNMSIKKIGVCITALFLFIIVSCAALWNQKSVCPPDQPNCTAPDPFIVEGSDPPSMETKRSESGVNEIAMSDAAVISDAVIYIDTKADVAAVHDGK